MTRLEQVRQQFVAIILILIAVLGWGVGVGVMIYHSAVAFCILGGGFAVPGIVLLKLDHYVL